MIADPVMAAKVILGIEFDVFQAVLFRYMWFCPFYLDDSGVSTGKSERLFACAVLRAILIQHPFPIMKRIIAIYYWSLNITERVIIPKFDKYIETSEVFRSQLLPGHGGKFRRALQGAYEYRFRNGNVIQLPAGDFINDSRSNASSRFHELYVDEEKEIEARSKGLDRMLLDRCTAPGYNEGHPFWANKVCLMGHAEDRYTHPSWERHLNYLKLIREGSQEHVIMTSNYKDFTEFGASRNWRPDKRIRQAKISLNDEEFNQQWLGLWSSGSANWYSAKSRQECIVPGMVPECQRVDPDEIMVLGWDTAPGMTLTADWNSGTVIGVKQVDEEYAASCGHRVLRVEDRNGMDTFWRVRVVYAVALFQLSADQLSGAIHLLHRLFGFSSIVIDPGGGGDWVYKKMRDRRQLINGVWQDTKGLCCPEDQGFWPEALPIVARYGRSSTLLNTIWEAHERTGADGPIDRSHRELRKAFDSRALMWPEAFEDRSKEQLAAMTPEQKTANLCLDEYSKQLGNIKVVVDQKTQLPKPTGRGFLSFEADGKKDGAYSVMYSFIGAFALILGGGLTESAKKKSGSMSIA